MSYFNDDLRDVIGCIKNEDSASVLEFFIELKRKINNGCEIYSEFNLQLIFSDLTLKNNFSYLLSRIKIKRIILRSILKNKDKKISIDDLITNIFESNNQLDFEKYIRGGEFYSGAGSVVGRQVKMGKIDRSLKGASHVSIKNDPDPKITALKKKYASFYQKYGTTGYYKTNKKTNSYLDISMTLLINLTGGLAGIFLYKFFF